MLHDEFAAQLFGVLIDGIVDGGKVYVDKLYARFDAAFPDSELLSNHVMDTVASCDIALSEALQTELFRRPPQFLVVFAVMAHLEHGIPIGKMGQLPSRDHATLRPDAAQRLIALDSAVSADVTEGEFADFVAAAGGATTRIASRKPRFLTVWNSVTGD